MQKFLYTTIYMTLGAMLLGYMLSVLHMLPEARELTIGALVLHTLAYVVYIFTSKDDRDPRALYAILILLAIYLLTMFVSGFSGTSILLMGHVAFHLFVPRYLTDREINYPIQSIIGGFLMLVAIGAILFKIMHWPSVFGMMILGFGGLSLLLFAIGMIKGLNKKA